MGWEIYFRSLEKHNSLRHDKRHGKIDKKLNFSFSLQVRESVKMLADMQKRMEYIHSLRNTICMNHRKMTEQEQSLEKKVRRHKSENYVINNHIS